MNRYLVTYGKPRFLGIVAPDRLSEGGEERIKNGRLIVAHSHRGEEMAEIVGPIDEEQERGYRSLKTISEHGEGPVRGGDPVVTDLDFVRLPSDADLEAHASHAEMESENLKMAQELVEWHRLSIKLIDAELMLDEKKLFFYFTAEQRVDFRMLVKDLARRFRTRIELRQMGVRDEARIIRGLSSCGLPCCCSYWLNQFSPIGIKMVKEQNIALNPAKISGICGRLMCCMSFEHKVYKDLWAGLPNPGSKIKTPQGNYIVLSMDVAREALRCHKPTGGDIVVPISVFADFKQAVMNGEEWEVPEEAIPAFDLRKRSSCESCRRFTNQISDTMEATLSTGPTGSGTKKRESSRERSRPDGRGRPRPVAERSESAEAGDDGTRKRSSRRRGRRGTKRPAGAESEVATTQQQTPRPLGNAGQPGHSGQQTGQAGQRVQRPSQPKPRPQQAEGSPGGAPEGKAEGASGARRNRRRRRRPSGENRENREKRAEAE